MLDIGGTQLAEGYPRTAARIENIAARRPKIFRTPCRFRMPPFVARVKGSLLLGLKVNAQLSEFATLHPETEHTARSAAH
jgi:hypothetical protein